MNRHLDALRGISVRVALAATLGVAGLLAARQFLAADVLAQASDAVGTYLQTLGTIYAVLLAFVVFVVWTQFNESRSHIEHEASEVLDLHRTSEGLPDPLRAELRTRLARYVSDVLSVEWPAMAAGDRRQLERSSVELEKAFAELRAFEPGTAREEAIFGEALSRFNQLHDARTLRLTSVCLHVPFGLRLLLYGGAVMVVGSTYLLSVPHLGLHAFIASALAGAIAHVLYLVDDLDDAFSGDWQVPRNAFERARQYFENASFDLSPPDPE